MLRGDQAGRFTAGQAAGWQVVDRQADWLTVGWQADKLAGKRWGRQLDRQADKLTC